MFWQLFSRSVTRLIRTSHVAFFCRIFCLFRLDASSCLSLRIMILKSHDRIFTLSYMYMYVQPREFEPQFRTPRRLFTFELMAHGSHSDMNVSSSTSALFITSRVLWGHQVHSLFRFCRNLWRFSILFMQIRVNVSLFNEHEFFQ